jgi:hypothetical protein
VGAGFGEAGGKAFDAADHQSLPDQALKVDAFGDQIAARLGRRQLDATLSKCSQTLGRNQSQILSAAVWVRERTAIRRIAIALKAALGKDATAIVSEARSLLRRGRKNRYDGATPCRRTIDRGPEGEPNMTSADRLASVRSTTPSQ